jgi:hypothetical protein
LVYLSWPDTRDPLLGFIANELYPYVVLPNFT